jgi:hypothetical protein
MPAPPPTTTSRTYSSQSVVIRELEEDIVDRTLRYNMSINDTDIIIHDYFRDFCAKRYAGL